MGGSGGASSNRSSRPARTALSAVAMVAIGAGLMVAGFRGGIARASHVAPVHAASPPVAPFDLDDCVLFFDVFPNRRTHERWVACKDDPQGFLSQEPPPTIAEEKRVGVGVPARDGGLRFTYA